MKRVEKFLREDVCPDCGGTRLSEAARRPRLLGLSLDEVCRMTFGGARRLGARRTRAASRRRCVRWRRASATPFAVTARRLLELGLGYLTLDRAASTLSTGERQRMQLARAVRNRTTGVLYVLDEPSIGLHPSNHGGADAA